MEAVSQKISPFCVRSGISGGETNPNFVNRRALLVFADPTGLDLSRRGLPPSLRPLLSFRRLGAAEIAADFHLFRSGKTAALPGFECHDQRGATFAERLEAATEEIALLGYEEVVLIGCDCPPLTPGDVVTAFAELATNRLVLGPDHRGGCYLIALHASDRHLLLGNSLEAQYGSRTIAKALRQRRGRPSPDQTGSRFLAGSPSAGAQR